MHESIEAHGSAEGTAFQHLRLGVIGDHVGRIRASKQIDCAGAQLTRAPEADWVQPPSCTLRSRRVSLSVNLALVS